jgi:transcriptional regulator with XRE-family HTH domain
MSSHSTRTPRDVQAGKPPKTLAAVSTRGSPGVVDRTTLGRRIREARKHLGITLVALAETSGVSATTISRAERGELTLSYDKFSGLAQALNLDMGAMFAGAATHVDRLDHPLLTRSGAGVAYEGPTMAYEFLGNEASGKQMNPIRGAIFAKEVTEYTRHPGEEFIFVLSGRVGVHFEDGSVFELRPGDTLYFSSDIGHAYVSLGPKPAEFISACTAETSHVSRAHKLSTPRGSKT